MKMIKLSILQNKLSKIPYSRSNSKPGDPKHQGMHQNQKQTAQLAKESGTSSRFKCFVGEGEGEILLKKIHINNQICI